MVHPTNLYLFINSTLQGNAQSGLPPGMGGNPPGDKDKEQKEKEVISLHRLCADHPETKAQMGTPSTGKNRQEEAARPKHGV
jgi:hypothetical protein